MNTNMYSERNYNNQILLKKSSISNVIVSDNLPETEFDKMLKKEGLDRESFFTGSWYVVPSAKARQTGNLITGYGHDDRGCLFLAASAATC